MEYQLHSEVEITNTCIQPSITGTITEQLHLEVLAYMLGPDSVHSSQCCVCRSRHRYFQ